MSAIRASNTPDSDANVSVDVVNAELFRALGHPARIRALELLRTRREMSVRELQAALQLEPGATSQHLSAMRRQQLLTTRPQGTRVFYRVRDPRTFQLLDLARQILTSQVEYGQTLLDGLNDASSTGRKSTRPARR